MPRPGRKEHLLESAVALFSRKGYHGTTVREIADDAGMLSGSLYAHISSKEDLLYEIVLWAARQFLESLQSIADGPGRAAGKLRAGMAAHLRVMADSRAAATVFMHEWKALTGERLEEVANLRRAYEALWSRIISEGMQAGEFRKVDGKYARLLILSAVNWVYQWYDPEGPLGADQLAEKFADLILAGLAGCAETREGSHG